MTAKHQGFAPYQNESDVLRIGNLAIENRLDRITISGDTDLTADRAGLAQARTLHALLGEIVASLEGQALPASLPSPAGGSVDNPFD